MIELSAVEQQLVAQVQEAHQGGQRLTVGGGGTRAFLGAAPQATRMDTRANSGIIALRESERTLTVRAATSLIEIESVLEQAGLQIACGLPALQPESTVGGAVSAGMAGPGRVSGGDIKDQLLGAVLVNGRGEPLRFGGDVMKNVAGYDLARLPVGAFGDLGLLLQLTLKLQPRTRAETSLHTGMGWEQGQELIRSLQLENYPLLASAYEDGNWILRLGCERAQLPQPLQGAGEQPAQYWRDLRDQRTAFHNGPGNLWRIVLPQGAPLLAHGEEPLVAEWHGALQWLRSDRPASEIFAAAAAAGGHARLFRSELAGLCSRPDAGTQTLHRKIKTALDPHGVFVAGPGNLFAEGGEA
ncbi:glycolate oxidase subunit GlcE [Biformimicrobium ophioploci]|uniref:Glycolate oxidase subunit GlcE n=1 Tax=Biformimicrobium ophioploci TaxID=3036711 RepID=A0ABQ6M0S9_9GAMM|nr:glycolate oxidase subunit GlcE [Microbulbifer sp. NKW57]GMG87921.1 glycolate oxidase subunit GlcE [Microbulbifer sp. NKW57]